MPAKKTSRLGFGGAFPRREAAAPLQGRCRRTKIAGYRCVRRRVAGRHEASGSNVGRVELDVIGDGPAAGRMITRTVHCLTVDENQVISRKPHRRLL